MRIIKRLFSLAREKYLARFQGETNLRKLEPHRKSFIGEKKRGGGGIRGPGSNLHERRVLPRHLTEGAHKERGRRSFGAKI